MNRYIMKIELIEKYIKENNLTKTKFCRLCEISMPQLRNIKNGGRVKITTLSKICDATKMKPDDLLGLQIPYEKIKKA